MYPGGPFYPPGTYSVPRAMPYGTYGASIDFGTGQFNNGVAANPCTFSTFDAAGFLINSGTFNSYSQAPPRAEIDRDAAQFRTSGCTPWALTALESRAIALTRHSPPVGRTCADDGWRRAPLPALAIQCSRDVDADAAVSMVGKYKQQVLKSV
jgi:hypothetical protein